MTRKLNEVSSHTLIAALPTSRSEHHVACHEWMPSLAGSRQHTIFRAGGMKVHVVHPLTLLQTTLSGDLLYSIVSSLPSGHLVLLARCGL